MKPIYYYNLNTETEYADTEICRWIDRDTWSYRIKTDMMMTYIDITQHGYQTRKEALKSAQEMMMKIFGQCNVVKCKDNIDLPIPWTL